MFSVPIVSFLNRNQRAFIFTCLIFSLFTTVSIIYVISLETIGFFIIILFILIDILLLVLFIFGIFEYRKSLSYECPHCGKIIKILEPKREKIMDCPHCWRDVIIKPDGTITKTERFLKT
jgi:DNA-directed RNA polymerase subunit RPC12/RpoP